MSHVEKDMSYGACRTRVVAYLDAQADDGLATWQLEASDWRVRLPTSAPLAESRPPDPGTVDSLSRTGEKLA